MLISAVLAAKGAAVATAPPGTPVAELVQVLAEHRIGAVVVTSPDGTVSGIVSERDVVRRLHTDGIDLLTAHVGDLMTVDVHTCGPGDTVDGVLATMTELRVRHVPVVDSGALVGIVSIGDLVKTRMDELQAERDHLTAYITS